MCVCVCGVAQEAALRGSRPTNTYLQKYSVCVCVQFNISMSLMLAKELKFRVCVVLQRLCFVTYFLTRQEESKVFEDSFLKDLVLLGIT